MTRAKIVCTLGPATDGAGILEALIRNGMSAARLNFSHGSQHDNGRRLMALRSLAGGQVAVIADLKGPKLRIGEIAAGVVTLSEGKQFILTRLHVPGDERSVSLEPPEVLADIPCDARILLDDGLLELRVVDIDADEVRTEVVVGGPLSSRKGVNLPGILLRIPTLTEKDKADALYAAQLGADYVALSLVRRAVDIEELRAFLASHGYSIPILAKIEKREAVDDLTNVLRASDAVMLARGDLGVEMPPEDVPVHQKQIVRAANEAAKPVIVATQMLQSMIGNPRPTRAEASDVANAVFDGADAVMLSGETAVGKYPIAALVMMRKIVEAAEASGANMAYRRAAEYEPQHAWTRSICEAASEIALELNAKAIIASTVSGYTARMVALHRPPTPILAPTPDPRVAAQLNLVWGVTPLVVEHSGTTDEMVARAVGVALGAGYVRKGDMVVVTAGVPVGITGHTTMLMIREV